jgi:uncharacterized protein (TIGR03083 family)
MDLTTSELLELGLDAVETPATDIPSGLRARVLHTASARMRPAMHPDWAGGGGHAVTPHAAFIKTASELATMLDSLGHDDWSAPTSVGGTTVRELMAHLVGVERYMLGQLGSGPSFSAPRREDHLPVSQEAAADLADATGPEIAQAWWNEVTRLIAVCAELGPQHEVAYHHLAGSVRGMLVVRTFELWTHDDDIRLALHRPPNMLDGDRLALMSSDLMNVLNLGMALSGTTQPGRTARINLMGPGGGSYEVALSPGETPGLPDITITTSVLDLCRLASNRLSADHFDFAVDGDAALLEPILVGATAFACD